MTNPLTVAEASVRLGVSPATVYRLVQGGEIAHLPIKGKIIRIFEDALDEFIKRNYRPATYQPRRRHYFGRTNGAHQ